MPEDKVIKATTAIDAALDQRWIAADEVQSLIGLLGFCGQVLIPGRWRMTWSIMALRAAVHRGFAPMNSFWLD